MRALVGQLLLGWLAPIAGLLAGSRRAAVLWRLVRKFLPRGAAAGSAAALVAVRLRLRLRRVLRADIVLAVDRRGWPTVAASGAAGTTTIGTASTTTAPPAAAGGRRRLPLHACDGLVTVALLPLLGSRRAPEPSPKRMWLK